MGHAVLINKLKKKKREAAVLCCPMGVCCINTNVVSIQIVNKGDWRGLGDMGTMPEVTQGWSWALQWKKKNVQSALDKKESSELTELISYLTTWTADCIDELNSRPGSSVGYHYCGFEFKSRRRQSAHSLDCRSFARDPRFPNLIPVNSFVNFPFHSKSFNFWSINFTSFY